MAKLFFIHSTMNSGKSLDLLKTAHNYESQGKRVLVFTSDKDTRYMDINNNDLKGIIKTRIGLEREALLLERFLKTENYMDYIKEGNYDCVLVDEAQFLPREAVLALVDVVDRLQVPVICYGLKNDFRNQLFEGSEALLLFADKIQEIKTVCTYCDRKATMNMRIMNGVPEFDGAQIQMGGNESYVPVCRQCYKKRKYNYS
jgi:thymidine kinase